MDEYKKFREKVRNWLEENAPPQLRMSSGGWFSGWFSVDIELVRRWQRKAYEAGFIGISWPKEYGGWGEDPFKEIIVREEFAKFNVPYDGIGLGIPVVGPTLLAHGTEEQKKRYIKKILTAEEIWCQGFSEPTAGSDLANIQTKAEDKGEYFEVSGQKIWSSFAHVADFMLLLARTGSVSDRHKGLVMLIVDMKSQGVKVSPIRQITGNADFNIVYLDKVKVPKENMIGKIGDGWKIAMSTLNRERLNVGIATVFAAERVMRQLLSLFTADHEEIKDLAVEIYAVKSYYKRIIEKIKKGYDVGPEITPIKIKGSESLQRVYEEAVKNMGIEALVIEEGFPNSWIIGLLGSRGRTIAGGTSEILRNVIGEVILGLPKG
ncbi:MAG: acyl-CoA dehydrogenase family protein [Sulfolobaceae archaeon]